VKKEEAVSRDLVLEEAMYLVPDCPCVDDKLHLFRLTQHTTHSISYLYVCAICFGLYLGYPQACQ